MTSLGIPALVSGVLTTTSATGKLQQAEQEKVAVLRSLGDQAGLSSQGRAQSFEAVGGAVNAPAGPSSALDTLFAFVQPAFAQSSAAQQSASRFDPGIQIQRPYYVLVLKRAASQEDAIRLAKEIQKDVPTAHAVKTDQGFFVVDSMTPRGINVNHIAICYPDREAWLKQIAFLKERGVPFHLRIDHGMTHSVYISDPNGHGIEILYELPREIWEHDIEGAQNYSERIPPDSEAALTDSTEYPRFPAPAHV